MFLAPEAAGSTAPPPASNAAAWCACAGATRRPTANDAPTRTVPLTLALVMSLATAPRVEAQIRWEPAQDGFPRTAAEQNGFTDHTRHLDMWDYLRARKEGRASSGNGRRQSYQHLPMVRMTNTYIENGADDPADIIASTERGVYVTQLGGGQVNTATGDFVFGMTEAYLIEGGRITEPLREGNLIGNGPKVLQDIDAVGNDFAMGHPGTCGKDGQGVPVGDGVPTLRVKALTVGGTAA